MRLPAQTFALLFKESVNVGHEPTRSIISLHKEILETKLLISFEK
jgi:hypothetical protein